MMGETLVSAGDRWIRLKYGHARRYLQYSAVDRAVS